MNNYLLNDPAIWGLVSFIIIISLLYYIKCNQNILKFKNKNIEELLIDI